MDLCPDCGSRQIETRVHDGDVVHECGLCGALGGEPASVRRVLAHREARAAGVDPDVWPLVRVLDTLPGLRVLAQKPGGAARGLPSVQWQLLDLRGLAQLENLGKSLQLARRSLRLPWRIELEFEFGLVFTLQARPELPCGQEQLAHARADLEQLARAVERDRRLSWWQRPRPS